MSDYVLAEASYCLTMLLVGLGGLFLFAWVVGRLGGMAGGKLVHREWAELSPEEQRRQRGWAEGDEHGPD